MSQFLRQSEGPRGLARLEFTDTHGQGCSFQESSAADCVAAWLGIDRVGGGGRMHLNQEMARELGQKLIEFAETGDINLGQVTP